MCPRCSDAAADPRHLVCVGRRAVKRSWSAVPPNLSRAFGIVCHPTVGVKVGCSRLSLRAAPTTPLGCFGAYSAFHSLLLDERWIRCRTKPDADRPADRIVCAVSRNRRPPGVASPFVNRYVERNQQHFAYLAVNREIWDAFYCGDCSGDNKWRLQQLAGQ